MRTQELACERLVFEDEPPRACRDAKELLASPHPLTRLEAAGYPVSDTMSGHLGPAYARHAEPIE